jgi:hypothetical protein
MIAMAIGALVSLIWIAVEFYTAPTLDQRGKVIKEGKKLKDILKSKK